MNTKDAYSLLEVYRNNALYQSAFHFGIAPKWAEDDCNVGISSVIDSFIPANILIFEFITENIDKKTNIHIKTLDIERAFDFEKKVDFINFMYNAWEEKINAYYKLTEAMLLNQNDYKVKNMLYGKYRPKFQQ